MPDGQFPPEPVSNTLQAWIAMNVAFRDMLGAGFTEQQACAIMGAWLANMTGSNDA